MGPFELYVGLCNSVVGRLTGRNFFQSYQIEYKKADLPLLPREYLSCVVVTPALVFVVALAVLPLGIMQRMIMAFLAASLSFFLLYIYPLERIDSRKRRIDAELPLALNYMSAILGSGASPITGFKMLAEFKEYEELSKEARRIARDCETLGMDLPQALDKESLNCPSRQFSEIMRGLKSEIISGGNITQFFEEKATDRMAHYAREQENYKRVSDTLASIYLVVALVAPLLFVTGIAIVDFVATSGASQMMTGPQMSGFVAFEILNLGVFVAIPLINIVFIVIVKMTQPEVI